MGRIVGIDYGRARIGVAVSDETQFLARALICLPFNKLFFSSLHQELSKLGIIDSIVIGLPIQLNGKEGEMAIEVRKFAVEMEKHLPYPIVFWDERLTSAQAEKALIAAEFNRKKRAAHSDTMSATIILQNFLDSKSFQKGC
jgi:putative Holliday junction resolvase